MTLIKLIGHLSRHKNKRQPLLFLSGTSLLFYSWELVKGELNSILFESITWAVVELSLTSIQIQIKVYLALIGIEERRILAAG